MNETSGENKKTTKSKAEVEAYLAKLFYTLGQENTSITFQEDRRIDSERDLKYTNRYTITALFPDESPRDAMWRELQKLTIRDYIETVKDIRFPKRSEMWVFGKRYSAEDVYIKIRVEVLPRNTLFVMSFHFSTSPFINGDFPYAKGEDG